MNTSKQPAHLVPVLFGEAEDDLSALSGGVGGVKHLKETKVVTDSVCNYKDNRYNYSM